MILGSATSAQDHDVERDRIIRRGWTCDRLREAGDGVGRRVAVFIGASSLGVRSRVWEEGETRAAYLFGNVGPRNRRKSQDREQEASIVAARWQ